MPINSDNSQNQGKQEATSVFEVPDELISSTKKDESQLPPIKKDLGKRRYFLVFTTLEGTPSFEVVTKSTVGRTTGDITIADPNLSNEHATFSVQEGLMSVIDHGSTNGTFIDGKRIKPGKNMIIDVGDHVLLGSIKVEIKLELPDKYAKLNENVTLAPEENVEEKKPSFWQRLKSKLASKKSPKKEKKFEIKNILPTFTDTVGAATRLWAFAGDLSLTMGLIVVIGDNEYFNMVTIDLYNELMNLIGPHLPKEPIVSTIISHFKVIFPVYILFYSLKLISSLLIGVSISQALMGLKGGKSVLWNRAGGFLRTVIEMATAPLLILDFPALFSRRTVKEILTFTNISAGNRLLRFVGTLIFVPCLIIFAIVSPTLRNLDYIDQGILVEEKVPPRKKKSKKAAPETAETVKEPKTYKIDSPILCFSSEVTLSDDFLLIPDFEPVTIKGKKMLIPDMNVYDLDKKSIGEFSVFKRYSVVDFVRVAEEWNPLFPFNFKELSRWYGNRNSPTLSKNKTKVKGLFSPSEASEMETLIIKSLQLNLISAHEHMLEFGPFLKSYADVREVIKVITEKSYIKSVMIQKTSKSNLLIIPSNEDEETFDLIIPINNTSGVVYKFSWKGPKGKSSSEIFYKDFFAKLEPPTENGAEFPKGENSQITLNPFNISDLFFSKKLSKDQREILFQYIFNYFYSLGDTSLKKSDEVLQKLILKTLQHYINYLKFVPDLDTIQKEKTEKSLTSLETALKNKDAIFFGSSP